jgi:hypothetical protein
MPRFRKAVVERRGTSYRSRPLEKTEAIVASGFKQWVNSSGMAKCKAPSGSQASRQKLADAPSPTRTVVIDRYRGRRWRRELQCGPRLQSIQCLGTPSRRIADLEETKIASI